LLNESYKHTPQRITGKQVSSILAEWLSSGELIIGLSLAIRLRFTASSPKILGNVYQTMAATLSHASPPASAT